MAGTGRSARRFDLRQGERLSFGSCDCWHCDSRLVLQTWFGLWFRGVLTADADTWSASNLSADLDLWCVDLEETGQGIRVAPGRADMCIPFEFTGVEVRLHGRPIAPPITVIGAEPRSVPTGTSCTDAQVPERTRALRPGTAYMAVLEELARGASRLAPPTSAEISKRLARRGLPLSRRAVDHHIEYLCQRLLPEIADLPVERGWRRVALAAIARRARLSEVQEGIT